MMFSVIYMKLFSFTIFGIVTCRYNTLSLLARDPLPFRHERSSNANNMESRNETKVESMTVESSVSTRFAEVIVRSVVVNQLNTDNEVSFTVQIPQSAFIYNFSMMIGDKLYVGILMEKEKAKHEYGRARDQGQSAGYVHQQRPLVPDRDMDIFTISINVASKSCVTFELVYQELLERKVGYYEQRFNVHPNQILANLTLIARYFEPQGFSDYYYTKPGSDIVLRASSENVVVSQSPEKLWIIYNPTVEEQTSIDPQKGLVGQFVVRYDITHKLDAGLIIYNKDFMAHFFSSPPVKTMGKSIVFVIDISGSMSGRKIEQVKQAMLAILPQLQEEDYFNIIIFDHDVIAWRDASVMASKDNIELALDFSRKRIVARGSTNIYGALLNALKLFSTQLNVADHLRHYAKIIVFLTDGSPTSGKTTNLKEIRSEVKNVNKNEGGGRLVSIYALGFGFGMDFNFLKHLSWENGGVARRIYDAVDAGKQLDGFYKEIQSPCYVDLQFNYMVDDTVLITNDYDVSETSYMVYYCGSEIVVVGKFENEVIDVAKIRATGADQAVTLTSTPVSSDSLHINPLFTERLWAYAMIKDLIKESDILEDNIRASEIKLRALNMSLQYHLVTPLTSLVVTEALGDMERRPNSRNPTEMGSIQAKKDVNQNTYMYNDINANSVVIANSRISSATSLAINIILKPLLLTVSITLYHVVS
ncbi:hypothetical protein CHS0354_028238 [Potamilus streckersoni]|uniref:Inter-alpha-trypsin inhibitor heavy chain H3-like n=1 Tax=Potamilus streckersoni TaxID=2493646 RepID=A0AAE0RTU8_9BIVA|nr:hypothetical protein CHS0354_028238 [Potamilus streckersoni]